MPALPKFNIKNDKMREHLLEVGERWVRLGVDGWRQDAPDEITAEGFWEALWQWVRAVNPQAYLVGEVLWSIDITDIELHWGRAAADAPGKRHAP